MGWASKFGLIGLAESLAWELTNYNVRVMTIYQGKVATSMQEHADPHFCRSQKHNMLTPSKVANKIVNIIFDQNSNKCQSGEPVGIGYGFC